MDTSQWAARVLGDQDVLEIQKSRGESTQGFYEKTTVTETKQNVLRTRPIFLPSEISHFENLTGVIRVSGWPLLKVQWPYQEIGQRYKLVEDADWVKKKVRPMDPLLEAPTLSMQPVEWKLEP